MKVIDLTGNTIRADAFESRSAPGGVVESVNGQGGVVVLGPGDLQGTVTDLSGSNVQEMLEDIASRLVALESA